MTTTQPAVAETERGVPPAEADVVPISDRVLLERHLGGDERAFAQLMEHYARPVYAYLARSGIPARERDDLFQEVFCKVHRASQRRLPEGPVRAWVFTIAINTVRDAFRKAKVRSGTHLHADPGEGRGADEPDPERRAEARQTVGFLDAEIAKLPLEQREALLLHSVEGVPLEELSEMLDVPVNTLKTRVRRARLALAQAMQRRATIADREER